MIGKSSWLSSGGWSFVSFSLGWVLLAAAGLSGCATMYDGLADTPKIKFTSEPDGALVELEDGSQCTTPCKMAIKPAKEQDVTATLAGYKPGKKFLGTRISYPFWGNILFGVYGLIGAAVDWYTDAIYTYKRDKYHFALAKADGDEDDDDDGGGDDSGVKPGEPAEQPQKPAADSLSKRTIAPAKALPNAVKTPLTDSASESPVLAPLPDTPEVRAIKEDYPSGYVQTEIGYYYGDVTVAKRQEIENRLYYIMLDMEKNGEQPDIDEAVRRDRFEQLAKPDIQAEQSETNSNKK